MMMLIISNSIAQNLSNFSLLANYTLINTKADKTGYSEDITLKNMPYHGNEGVYSNGIYQTDDGCYFLTPNFTDWNYTKIAASIEFKVENQDFDGPVVIFGSSYKYFGAWIKDSNIQMIYNDAYSDTLNNVLTNTWHKLVLVYDNSIGKMYLDGKLLDSIEFIINNGGYDNQKEIVNYHGGNGYVYKGYLRNLKVYGEKSSSSPSLVQKSKNNDIKIFPNPNNGNFTIIFKQKISENCKIILINQNGIIVNSSFSVSNNRINVKTIGLNAGNYFIEVFSQDEKIISKKITIF